MKINFSFSIFTLASQFFTEPRLLSIKISVAIIIMMFSSAYAQQQIIIDNPTCAGMSGFRAFWNQPIPVAENGVRIVKDNLVKDRGQTAVWDGVNPGPLAFDAMHRSLMVRFPDAGQRIANELAQFQEIEKVELVLPYVDEEIWPQGRTDFASPDGYRYRTNWDCDNYYRGVVLEKTKKYNPSITYREERPNWHAVAYVLRKTWHADSVTGPTYNAAIKGIVYWKNFGASDTNEDRFPGQLGPVEVSSYHPEGRLDVTSVLIDKTYGKTLADRLKVLSDCGFILNKQELYDHRYFVWVYEFTGSAGPRAIIIKQPKLVVTLKPGTASKVGKISPIDVASMITHHKIKPQGKPTAVLPSPEEVKRLNEKFMSRPSWMPDWQYNHVQQLMSLNKGHVQSFFYNLLPSYAINEAISKAMRKNGKKVEVQQAELDYAVYLSWLDWINGRPFRYYEGHLTAAQNVIDWYNFREAIPSPIQNVMKRNWTAWLMPDRQSATDLIEMADYSNISGKLIHPMADDPRVGVNKVGQAATWDQGDTYYKETGDWRGNKSFFRSGFTRTMSTANFNSTAITGALLNGQIIDSKWSTEDGRSGLMKFPFWMWTYNSGVHQEYIDHYYWAIATSGNKLFADFCEQPQDKMAGKSIIQKTINDLAISYHPNLKKLMGPSSRTGFEHILGQQDGLYHILHVISPRGALCDLQTGDLPGLAMAKSDKDDKLPKAPSAWGADVSPESIAINSMNSPWADPWITEWVDEKPIPWFILAEKKMGTNVDWVSTYFGENYGLTSIRQTVQRIHVLGHWRRKAELPSSMRDIGTLDMRIGFNQTQIANDLAGLISEQGHYRTYQHRNKVIMLARPNPEVIKNQAKAHSYGLGKVPAQDIKSIQCTAALFNYQQSTPTWEIFVDNKKVEILPATAVFGQIITVHDGVSYLAIRPLPTDNLGRDSEIILEAGKPQPEAGHENFNIQPALLINANFYQRDSAISSIQLDKLKNTHSGFVVEMGDEKEYGSFKKFQEHIRSTRLAYNTSTSGDTIVEYSSGNEILKARISETPQLSPNFTVNGIDPYANAVKNRIWQDTPLSQMGMGLRIDKCGAFIERNEVKGISPLLLQVFPKEHTYVCTNPTPNYIAYSFTTPEGVNITANGLCSMGQWIVRNGNEINIRYEAFKNAENQTSDNEATLLFISGTKTKPIVILNEKELTGSLKAWDKDGISGWLVPLNGSLSSSIKW